MPEQMDDALKAADRIIELTGGEIRLGLPLGLGKPNRLVNALYQRATENPDVRLDIYTALSLGRPGAGSDLEKRFLEPFAERVFGDYEELDYLKAAKKDQLPDNIRVFEFFFQPGSMLGSNSAQRHYISVNYTHAARDLNARGVNVVAQLLACRPGADGENGNDYSFSCNPEVTLELLPMLKARRDAGETIVTVPLAGVQVGMAICYDLRFPVLAQRLVSAGAQLLVYPSAFTAVTGAAHWELLLRATAVQTGCYVLGANQCGQHGPRRASYGHSMLVSPWGDVVASLENEPGALVAPLDLATMDELRQRMPVQQHQRLRIEGPYDAN